MGKTRRLVDFLSIPLLIGIGIVMGYLAIFELQINWVPIVVLLGGIGFLVEGISRFRDHYRR